MTKSQHITRVYACSIMKLVSEAFFNKIPPHVQALNLNILWETGYGPDCEHCVGGQSIPWYEDLPLKKKLARIDMHIGLLCPHMLCYQTVKNILNKKKLNVHLPCYKKKFTPLQLCVNWKRLLTSAQWLLYFLEYLSTCLLLWFQYLVLKQAAWIIV